MRAHERGELLAEEGGFAQGFGIEEHVLAEGVAVGLVGVGADGVVEPDAVALLGVGGELGLRFVVGFAEAGAGFGFDVVLFGADVGGVLGGRVVETELVLGGDELGDGEGGDKGDGLGGQAVGDAHGEDAGKARVERVQRELVAQLSDLAFGRERAKVRQ